MAEPGSAVFEIERLVTQVVVVGLTLVAAMLTRRGIYGRDEEAIAMGFALALAWALVVMFARWRQGPGAWWLLITAPVALAMPATTLVVWALK